MSDEFEIHYHQVGSYGGKEFSITFENIAPVTLELIPTKEYVGTVPTFKALNVQKFQENKGQKLDHEEYVDLGQVVEVRNIQGSE